MTRTMLIITPAIIIGIIIAMVIATVRSTISMMPSNGGVFFFSAQRVIFCSGSSSSRCKAIQTNTQADKLNEKKIQNNKLIYSTKAKMCAPIKVLEHETGPLCSLALSCFWKVTWLEENQPWVPAVTPKKQGEHAVGIIHFFSKVELKEKKHRHVDHIFRNPGCGVQETPSEALMESQTVLVRRLHWSLHQPYDL